MLDTTEKIKKEIKSEEGDVNGLPLPIPDFTPIVKFGLRSGDSSSVWKHMMDQCFNFYSANYLKACDGVAVYQQIGRDIYRKYKSVARDGELLNLVSFWRFIFCVRPKFEVLDSGHSQNYNKAL